MPDRPVLPVPAWLLAADFVSALLLGIGLTMVFDAGIASGLGAPMGSGPVLALSGGLGLIACTVAIFRHLRAAAATRSSFPR